MTAQHIFAQHAAAAAAAVGHHPTKVSNLLEGSPSTGAGPMISASFPSPAALLVHPSTTLLQTLRAAEQQYQEVVCGPRSSDSNASGGSGSVGAGGNNSGSNNRLTFPTGSSTVTTLISWNPTWEAVQETSARLLFMAVRWVKGLEPFQTLSKRDQV